ncbi:MAG: dipeptide epimerase [Phycisphaerae bacterium]
MSPVSDYRHIVRLRIWALSIPLRRPFGHAAKVRTHADPIVVEVELSDGTHGYGETLPRPYVSGETPDSVVQSIADDLIPDLVAFRPTSFPEALERIDALPDHDETGDVITAARSGVELALLDAYSKAFGKPISEAVNWLGLPGFGSPGSVEKTRYSGVLSGTDPAKLRRAVRMMYWYGLRDFKLKVGYEDDLERVATVVRALGRGLGRKTTLRLDANGAWTLETALERLGRMDGLAIRSVEQPLPRDDDKKVVALKQAVSLTVMHDESLVTMSDAKRLQEMGVADAFNIRISKNGGFLPAVRLAHFARKHNALYQLGCMVGETSILSAVGRRFLENVPGVLFAEGSYGRFLLTDDVVARPVRFGYGGRGHALDGLGWGVEVRPEQLERYAAYEPLDMPL